MSPFLNVITKQLFILSEYFKAIFLIIEINPSFILVSNKSAFTIEKIIFSLQ